MLFHCIDIAMISLYIFLHDRAFLLCVFAGGFSVSANGGNECHRSRMDMASLRYESEREPEGERPVQKKVTLFFSNSFSMCLQLTVTQSTHLHKSSATCLTLVWLFSWVNPCVGFEVCWSVELSPADIASIWFLSCSANERRLSKTSNVEAKITFVAAAVYFYRCELFCDWQGFPCSGMQLGNGHICMACRCGPEACGVSRLPPLQTWSRIHYRSMFHFL